MIAIAISTIVLIVNEDKSVVSMIIFYEVDGVKGFEPLNAGTKNQCLTAWRHPNKITVVLLSFKTLEL